MTVPVQQIANTISYFIVSYIAWTRTLVAIFRVMVRAGIKRGAPLLDSLDEVYELTDGHADASGSRRESGAGRAVPSSSSGSVYRIGTGWGLSRHARQLNVRRSGTLDQPTKGKPSPWPVQPDGLHRSARNSGLAYTDPGPPAQSSG